MAIPLESTPKSSTDSDVRERVRPDEPTQVTQLFKELRDSLHGAEEATDAALKKSEEVRTASKRPGSSPGFRLLLSRIAGVPIPVGSES